MVKEEVAEKGGIKMSETNKEIRAELENSIKEICLKFEQSVRNSKKFDEANILVIRNAYALGIKKGLEITTALKEAGIQLELKD